MAGEMKYGILLFLRDQVSGGLSGLQKRVDKFASATAGASRTARRGLLAMAGGLAAVTYAAAEQDKADRKLASTLQTLGEYTDEHFKALQDVAGAIQKVTAYGDEEIETQMAYALNLGISRDKLDEFMRGAIGLATALDKDLNSAVKYSAMAMQGQFTMLERDVGALRKATTEAEKLAIVQGLMARGFQQAKDESKDLMNQLKSTKNVFGDLLQEIGKTIFHTENWGATLEALQAKLEGAIEWVRNLTDEEKAHIITAIKLTAASLAVIAVLSPLARAFSGVLTAVKLLSSPLGIVAGLLAVIAVAALTVTDALGLTNTGVLNLLESFAPLDRFWTEFAAGMLRAAAAVRSAVAELAELNAKLTGWNPGLKAAQGLLGFDPERLAADLRAANQGTEGAVAGLWADYERRHPAGGAGGAAAPGGAADRALGAVADAAAQRAAVGGQVDELSNTLLPLISGMKADDKALAAQLADTNRRLKALATSR